MQGSFATRGRWFARALAFLLAATFALPSCFTYMLWDEKQHIARPPVVGIRDATMVVSESRLLQVPIAPASRAAWRSGLSIVTATTQAIVLELPDRADVDRVRELAGAPNATRWLDFKVALDGAVTAQLGFGTRSFPCRVRAVDAASSAPAFAPVIVNVYHDRRDDTPTVTRILLTPLAVAFDVVLLPFSLLGFFTL